MSRLEHVRAGLAIRDRLRAMSDEHLAQLIALYSESTRIELITLATARREQQRRKQHSHKGGTR